MHLQACRSGRFGAAALRDVLGDRRFPPRGVAALRAVADVKDSQLQLIDVDRLRVGMYVHLDLGWTEHPFPFNSFTIKSAEQIDKIRSLGLERVRYSPRKSDALEEAEPAAAPRPAAPEVEAAPVESPEHALLRERREMLASQQASLERCERQFGEASRTFRLVLQNARSQPDAARQAADLLVKGMVGEMTGEREVAIRLLSEKSGEETSLHALNVTVLSVLLGRACGLSEPQLKDIGLGGMLHDIGKLELPDRLRWRDDSASAAERKAFQQHVQHGIALGQRMGLPPAVLAIVAQHHEHADGSGYPNALRGDQVSIGARVVSLVNQYDNLCNPGNPALALTPHDALAIMFAKMRSAFDSATMAVMIRMMGVYPPGSVLQLNDGRFAIAVSVNPSRPLKPKVLIHDPQVKPDDALVVDLETRPELGVQRAIKPLQLPRAVFDYLSPRKRMCYFFERSRDSASGDAGT